jgi:replicative DNA helicase
MTDDQANLDKLPPHSPEAEQGVLGCIMLDPTDCLDATIERLQYGAEAFYEDRHKVLYDAIMALHGRKNPIDIITVQRFLKDAGQLEAVGGIAYLSQIQDSVPSAANLGYYIDIVREKHVLRLVLKQCTEAISQVYQFDGTCDQLLSEVEAGILKIRDAGSIRSEVSMKDLIRSVYDDLQRRYSGEDTGISTGFPSIDRVTGGLQPGEEFVLAARPSTGKTALAMAIAMNVAKAQHAVGVISLEMKKEKLIERMMAMEARVNTHKEAIKVWTDGDFQRCNKAAVVIKNLPIYFDDSPMNCNQIAAKARRWARKKNIKVLIIDYLQLIPAHRRGDRIDVVSEISTMIKGISKELNISVIVLAQLNRELEKDKKRKPRMADLRESGQIEQDADVIGFLYRDTDSKSDSDLSPAINLLIAKNRNGAVGEAWLKFHKEHTRFEDDTLNR